MQGLVTVFGGSGFLGGQIVRALAKRGLRVRVAVRNPGRGYRLRMLGDVGQIEVVQANVRFPDSIDRALEGAEAVINCVAVLFECGSQNFEALNAAGAKAIAEAAAARGITRFVQVSALGADAHSASKYARSKAEGEAAVREAIPSAVILRPSVIFGQDDHFFNFFASMATLPIPLMPLPLVGGGKTRFQPVYVADVAKAAATALVDPAAAGRTFELGGPEVMSFEQLMKLMLAEIGRKRTLLPIPFGLASLLGGLGDLQAALRSMLGLIPSPPLTTDQVRLLQSDNVVSEGAPGLADLGVTPTAMEVVIPTYLWRYRKGGQYADQLQTA
ncbi:MAG TPA: complex I NDUFA9 subunit family protein [Caulobacteraceae bacterium]|nr:complex I NDUFA9 subunit family protein [Caulobacteraceae bacterium]